jgi:hypothetical protein
MQEHNRNKGDHLRMGQRFIVYYIPKVTWPDLFYADDAKSIILIQTWLKDHQYIDNLPPKQQLKLVPIGG